MDRKKIILIIVGLLVIIGIIVAIVLSSDSTNPALQDQNTSQPQDQTQTTDKLSAPAELVGAEKKPEVAPITLSLITVARNFAEKYGSFSSDSGKQNLTELEVLSSAKMSQTLRNHSAQTVGKTGFYGVSSNAVSTKILSQDQSVAKVLVNLQRIETTDTTKTFYQKAQVGLIKSGNLWLVDNFNWQ